MNKPLDMNKDVTYKYALVGKFVAEFEQMVSLLRFGCGLILQSRGLKDFQLNDIIFGQKLFTADPLIGIYESFCNELLKSDEENKALLKEITKFSADFRKIIEFRNNLLHGEHRYHSNEMDMMVIKKTPDKHGHRIKNIVSSDNDLINNLEELALLQKNFISLLGKVSRVIDDFPDSPHSLAL